MCDLLAGCFFRRLFCAGNTRSLKKENDQTTFKTSLFWIRDPPSTKCAGIR